MKILVTGSAGFIGFHTCLKLLEKKKIELFGLDNLNNYYDVKFKKKRLSIIKQTSKNIKKNFFFYKIDISNKRQLINNFKKNKYDYVIHLAAQAGVRYSIDNPQKYFESNLQGFFNILEASRLTKVKHLIYASTSSVYGNNIDFPLKETQNTDNPLSFYAATKKSNEVMAYSYSNIYKLPCTGLRFFTVYGPNGRPDMSLYKFADAILKNKKINVFNHGNHQRDFTYVEDVVFAITKLIKLIPKNNLIPCEIYNIANGKSQELMSYINRIEKNLNIKAKMNSLPIQDGDVIKTHGSISKLNKLMGFKPKTNIEKGINKFINWFKNK